MSTYGYYTGNGFVGNVFGRMMLFVSEEEYLEYMEAIENGET